VLSLRGAVVAESVDPLPHPWLTQSLPLLDAGATVGTLEITRSIRPLLTRSAVLGLLLLPLGLLAFRMMRTLPLRALRRSEEEAQRQRETARRYEEELRHAEKLRAVGQLAAGVAHDFNNLLAVIKGCAAQLDREVPAESPLRDDVDEIMGAVERATSLTRSLLAFAHRQPMRLQPVDLVSVLRGCERSLRRVLREGIQLESRLPAEELPVMADPMQIEQILLNLALNAQDAMPYGGRVSIAASRVSLDGDEARRTGFELPGAYAELRVADDGVGMDPDTRARLFEPFFTTKDVGKGTGLGLSIVYGLVQQHRGVVHVASERSRGTAVTLLLPLLAAAAGEAPASTVASS
jgi:signal transduction histidine kinase